MDEQAALTILTALTRNHPAELVVDPEVFAAYDLYLERHHHYFGRMPPASEDPRPSLVFKSTRIYPKEA